MDTMKVLDLNLKYLTFLGINVRQTDDASFMRRFRFSFFLMGLVYSLGITCMAYFILHFTNVESSANEFIVFAAVIASVTALVSFALKAKSIKFLCEEFQSIADNGR